MVVVFLACVGLSCATLDTPETETIEQPVVVDAAHAGIVDGAYFLPPLVGAQAFSGVFDPDVRVAVRIDCLDCTAASPPILFTRDRGAGSESVRVDLEAQQYIVNWHTRSFAIELGRRYRIRLQVPNAQLAFADVTFLAAGGARNADTGDAIALQDGRTLPIKFRIERGAAGVGDLFAAGGSHVLARAANGAVFAWGSNDVGQLGDGTPTTRLSPVPIPELGPGSGVIELVAGGVVSYALKADGTVLAWGANSAGSLGDGTTIGRRSPGQVLGLGPGSGVVSVRAGGLHALALRSDGSVVSWGSNTNGQIGDGTTINRTSPVQVLPPGSGIVAIAAAGNVSFALREDGAVLAWGGNGFGQLGDGTTTQRTAPVQVSGLGAGSGVVAIASAGAYTLAMKADGTVVAWGVNADGQLGDGTTVTRPTPVAVSGLGPGAGVVAVAVGGGASFALRSDGVVVSWGANGSGQLGDGTTTRRLIPGAVSGLDSASDVVAIGAGTGYAVARLVDGSLLAWGLNDLGQLGNGTFLGSLALVDVPGLGAGSDVAALATGQSHVLALLGDGTVLAWGSNSNGQIGDGTTQSAFAPVEVFGPDSGVVAVSASTHSMALLEDGTVLAWGPNVVGQLGDGTTQQRTVPVAVEELDDVEAISAGNGFSVALSSDGTVMAWGGNANNQLGDGTVIQRNLPVQVSGLGSDSGIVAIAASGHTVALRDDGAVFAWGPNGFGQLGDGTQIQRSQPVGVSTLGPGSDVVAVYASGIDSFARLANGTLLGWGVNTSGQLADGTTVSPRRAPVQATLLGDTFVSEVAVDKGNSSSTFVLTDAGAVLGWGGNGTGQLGDGTLGGRLNPAVVAGLSAGVSQIHAGLGFLVVLHSDGAVQTIGRDAVGQLGDGPNSTASLTPAPTLFAW